MKTIAYILLWLNCFLLHMAPIILFVVGLRITNYFEYDIGDSVIFIFFIIGYTQVFLMAIFFSEQYQENIKKLHISKMKELGL